MGPLSLLQGVAALIVAAALSGGLGYWRGSTDAATRHSAAQDKATAKAAAAVRAEEARGDQLAAAYVQEHFDQEARYAALNQRNRSLATSIGLLAASPFAGGGPTDCAGRVDLVRSADAATAGPVAAGPELSHRAVWMWNSALAASDVPSGTCGLAAGPDGTDAACAAGAGVGLEDVWANHSANAQSCATDRARFAALIALLRERGLVEGGAP